MRAAKDMVRLRISISTTATKFNKKQVFMC